MVEAEKTKTFVDSALQNAGGALDGIQKAKDLFFGGKSPNVWEGVSGFFGMSLAQLQDNPHFSSKSDLAKADQIRFLLIQMQNTPVKHQERFLKENVFGIE